MFIDRYPRPVLNGSGSSGVAVGRVEVGMAEAHWLEHVVDVGDDRPACSCDFSFVRAAINMAATWYVTVELHQSGVLPRPRSPRHTTTFKTETEAKNFARAKLREGLIVFAGTINPVVPRKHISSHSIADWLSNEAEG